MGEQVVRFIVQEQPVPKAEPVYPRTLIPEGLGAAITQDSMAAMCDLALSLGDVPSGWPWRVESEDNGPGRSRSLPAIPVMDRWHVGAPMQLWPAGGPCRSYPAAYLAGFTFLEHDREGEEREAVRRAAQPTGWRARWERWFPSGRDPVIRLQDQRWERPPPGYFRLPRIDAYHGP